MLFSQYFSNRSSHAVPSAFELPSRKTIEQRDIERSFARCFGTEDGQKVLSHLQVLTFQRAYGPDSSDEKLRYTEGQRALVGMILRLIDRGRQ